MQNNPDTNIETRSLGLVQEQEEGWEARHFFSRKQGEKYGFTLVIFRQGRFLGQILSSEIVVPGDVSYKSKKLGVKPGDKILSINLGPHPITISSVLPTSDNAPRRYRILLEIKVRDHQKFAQEYIQGSDPVAHARVVIEGHLRRYLGTEMHDDINEERIRECAEQALLARPNDAIGLTVFNVPKVELWENEGIVLRRQKEREHEEKIEVLEKEAHLKQLQERHDLDLSKLKAQGAQELTEFKNQADLVQGKHEEDLKDLHAAREQQRQLSETAGEYELKRLTAEKERLLKIDVREDDFRELDHQHTLSMRQAQNEYEFKMLTTPNEYELKMLAAAKEQKLAELNRAEEVRIYEHNAYIEEKKAQSTLAQNARTFEMELRQKWIEGFGDKAMPGMIQRIIEAVASDNTGLGQAATQTELEYLFKLISDGTGTSGPSEPARRLITAGDSSVEAQTGRTSELRPTDSSEVGEALPGITQQRDLTIEIPDLGLRLIQTRLSPDQQMQVGISTDVGFIVCQIPDSRSTDLGFFKVGDILVEINDDSLTNISELSQAISAHEVGETIKAIVLRNEAAHEIEVANP